MWSVIETKIPLCGLRVYKMIMNDVGVRSTGMYSMGHMKWTCTSTGLNKKILLFQGDAEIKNKFTFYSFNLSVDCCMLI
jgi:hypothetical protein